VTEPNSRAVIVSVQLPGVSDEEHASSIAELARLAETLELEVVGRVSQRRTSLSRAAAVGRGKLKEIARYTGGEGEIPSPVPPKDRKNLYVRGDADDDEEEDDPPAVAEVPAMGSRSGKAGPPMDPSRLDPAGPRAKLVLVDHDLTPSQARNLERAVEAEVLDRTAVILAIFQRHARSREAKLEVEIARLQYMAPRLREVGAGSDRQRGGIGGRGAGESAVELDRRKVRDRIAELRRELDAIEETSRTRRHKRSEQNTVALVGYTNAGKSSLMRGLTGSEIYVADKLFATLDTTVRVLKPETKPRILVSDTVGFIKKLPHSLVASFRATLETAAEADLLLHVVDASDPAFRSHMKVTQELLAEIGADATPTLVLLNKIDRVSEEGRSLLEAALPDLGCRSGQAGPAADASRSHPEAILMSAKDPADVAQLRDRVVAFFERAMVDAQIEVPYARHAMASEIHERCRVLKEDHGDTGTIFSVRAEPRTIERLRASLGSSDREA
jgi:GTP-binding protein HflX